MIPLDVNILGKIFRKPKNAEKRILRVPERNGIVNGEDHQVDKENGDEKGLNETLQQTQVLCQTENRVSIDESEEITILESDEDVENNRNNAIDLDDDIQVVETAKKTRQPNS